MALAPLTTRALGGALGLHGVDILLQLGDPVADLAPVQLGQRLTRTTTAPAAALTPLRAGQLGHLAQARRHVAQPGDLHLGAGRAGPRVAVEDLEDDHGPVHHLAAQFHLQVARLGRRQFVIHQDDLDLPAVIAIHEVTHLLPLADAQISRRIKTGALLDEGVHHLQAQRLGQLAQLGQRRLELEIADSGQLDRGNHGVYGLFLDVSLHAERDRH